jgi:hypothetical protein
MSKYSKPFFPKNSKISKPQNDENNSNFSNLVGYFPIEPISTFTESAINTKCTSMNKFTCRFDIQIPNESEFRVAKKIIGYKGGNLKRICESANSLETGLPSKFQTYIISNFVHYFIISL